jgi:hypothetical protein
MSGALSDKGAIADYKVSIPTRVGLPQ